MKRELNNLEDSWNEGYKINKIKKKNNSQLNNKKNFRRGRPKGKEVLDKNSNNNDKKEQIKKHGKYKIENKIYFEFMEILSILKEYSHIDYENIVLKDEQKQEFKTNLNDFFKNNVR